MPAGLLRLLLLALIVTFLAACGGGSATTAVKTSPWIGVQGNRLVDQAGKPVRLLGVNRSGTEYACRQGTGIFQGPSDAASIAAIKSWDANAVRIPLNESCWLGIDGVPARFSGAAYREAIVGFVGRLTEAGLYSILDLQFAAPGAEGAESIIPMPDADHAPAFWKSVATTFGDDRAIVFDLYNEPHDVDWDCWQHGCQTETEGGVGYEAVGMERLVQVVRDTGARQPLLLSGINYAHDLRGWEAHLPPDPLDGEVASIHTYDFAPCLAACRAGLAKIALRHPLVAAEIGETDCGHTYIDGFMSWADEHDVSYLGWAWDAHHG
ncbi:MAG: cellulase family glycosylhydrolase, partial [Actinobacteria bacterium]|nr:cellulase family glycosylhydrolase [Actinomycetota bacterium]